MDSDYGNVVEDCLFELQSILGDLNALRSLCLGRWGAENVKLRKAEDVVRDIMSMLQARLDGKGGTR